MVGIDWLEKEFKLILQINQFKPHYQERMTETINQTRMIPYPAQSKAKTLPPTRRHENIIAFRAPQMTMTDRKKTVLYNGEITIKMDISGKIAFDSGKLNETCIKKHPHIYQTGRNN